jgi:hypothetical protein
MSILLTLVGAKFATMSHVVAGRCHVEPGPMRMKGRVAKGSDEDPQLPGTSLLVYVLHDSVLTLPYRLLMM